MRKAAILPTEFTLGVALPWVPSAVLITTDGYGIETDLDNY